MNNMCKIIEDLLPLYIEDLTNEENTILIEEHLLSCENCKKLLNQMKDDLTAVSPIINSGTIEDKALSVAKIISKNQNTLKLSLCSVIILFAVVICSIPVTFVNTLALLVFAPFVSRLLYGKNLPLLLISAICALIGGAMVTGSLGDSWVVAIGQLLLMVLGIFAGAIFTRARSAKGDKVKVILLTSSTLILLGIGFFINSSFNGNPVGYFAAQNKISAYIKKTYPTREVKISGLFFNWKERGYSAKVSKGSETFTINLYETGYIQDNYNINRANTYKENYAEMVEVALNSNFKQQYFWVVAGGKKDDNISLEKFVPTSDMDLIIRFTDSNKKTPPITVMSQNHFIELSKNVVNKLEELKLSYNNISFQAIDEDKKEMSLDLNKGLKLESIWKNK